MAFYEKRAAAAPAERAETGRAGALRGSSCHDEARSEYVGRLLEQTEGMEVQANALAKGDRFRVAEPADARMDIVGEENDARVAGSTILTDACA